MMRGPTRAPWFLSLMLVVGLPAGVEAGSVRNWRLKEVAAAPVLVVGRVLSVDKGERVPDGTLPWKDETLRMTAEVQVLRSYTNTAEPLVVERLRLRFVKYGPRVTAFMNGYPPPLPNIEAGSAVLLPLQGKMDEASKAWDLVADSGVQLVIPVRGELTASKLAPTTARAFLDREIANSVARGTPSEVSAISGYLSSQDEDLTSELMPLFESAIGDDRHHWAEVATNLMAAQGIPRPRVADVLAEKVESKEWSQRPGMLLTWAALRKLHASPDTDELLIAAWIAEAPWNDWGSANSLIEFADNPLTAKALRAALQNDVAGSSYIAWALANAGHPTALPEALVRALKVADHPPERGADLQGAAALLRDTGNDAQLKELAALVRKYQTRHRDFYHLLWQYASEAGNPREARVLAVVLRDQRIISGELRYCDFALGTLERAVQQHFGSGAKTLEERDAAVSHALAWLKTRGLTDY
jgi:hypothetical protein